MALYNVSINLKGLRYISESPGFVPLLWWLLSGKEGSPHSSPAADGGGDGSNLGAAVPRHAHFLRGFQTISSFVSDALLSV